MKFVLSHIYKEKNNCADSFFVNIDLTTTSSLTYFEDIPFGIRQDFEK